MSSSMPSIFSKEKVAFHGDFLLLLVFWDFLQCIKAKCWSVKMPRCLILSSLTSEVSL